MATEKESAFNMYIESLFSSWAVLVQFFNSSTQEADIGGSF